MVATVEAVKERPILFSAPMVRAILDGKKTQTRRIVNPQPAAFWDEPNAHAELGLNAIVNGKDHWISNRYGKRGDRLWVRETGWAKHDSDSDEGVHIDCGPCLDVGAEFHPGWQYPATPECFDLPKLEHKQQLRKHEGDPVPGDWWLSPPDNWDGDRDYMEDGIWVFLPWGHYSKIPSIHGPRWTSRITLEVTGVRVERLHEISQEDAIAEGVLGAGGDPDRPRTEFMLLWNKINGEKSWKSNPWVWVVEFKRIAQEVAAS